MSRPPFTPSGAWRVATCLGSAVQPGVRESTKATKFGQTKHTYLEIVGTVGKEAALATVKDPAARDVLAAIDLTGLPLDPKCFSHEVSLAWNWETGRCRVLPSSLSRDERDAMLQPNEIPMTVDVVAIVERGGMRLVFVGDWKPEWFEDPGQRTQLQIYAMAAARAYGCQGAICELIRPSEEGPARRERWELDEFDLAEVAERSRALALAVVAARLEYERDPRSLPTLHIGPWCNRCTARFGCEAQGKALARAHSSAMTPVELKEHLSEENAEGILMWLTTVISRAEEYMDVVKEYARSHPIRLRDGRTYGPVEKNFNVVRDRELWHMLRAEFGEDVAWAASKLKITQKELGVALGKVAKTRGVTKIGLIREVKQKAIDAGIWKMVPDEYVQMIPASRGGKRALPVAGDDDEEAA